MMDINRKKKMQNKDGKLKKKGKTAESDQEIEQLCLYICVCVFLTVLLELFHVVQFILLIKSDDLRH